MNFKLFVLALAGSAYGINKVEECVKDKCPTMDHGCITSCSVDNLTQEQFANTISCLSKCTSKSQNDPCIPGCLSNANSSEKPTNGTTPDGGAKTNGNTTNGNKNSGAVAAVAKSTAFAWVAVVGLNYIL